MTPILEHSFWAENAVPLLNLVGLVVTVLIWFLKYHRTFVESQYRLAEVADELKSLVHKVDGIDSRGTSWSQRSVERETELGKANSRRLDTLERSISEMLPKMAETAVNVEWITHHIRGIEKKKLP